MTCRAGRLLAVCAVFFFLRPATQGLGAEPDAKGVLAAMKKATGFMMNTVSNRGGFLYHYTDDLSKQWGEVPARKSQIWVQPPGTPTVGMMFLDAFGATGDDQYLKYADKVAGALIWGQLPSGGWHYLIDFEPEGLHQWYEEVASQCRGWEEFYHYNGNATFDDDTTASAARFLLRLYATTLDPTYRTPLLRALDFILEAQYKNGGWPQRYPLSHDFPYAGHPDYTSFYTFNDDVIPNNIYLLLEAYEKLGKDEYRKAAYRGMDFYIISQVPAPQAGWADQYDMELKPAWARSYEPPAVSSSRTVENIRDLERFYAITGDRRYLEPIPKAIEWLEHSVIKTDPSKRKRTHALFYEVGSNRPLYARHKVKDGKIDSYVVSYESFDLPEYGGYADIDISRLKREYEELRTLAPEKAKKADQQRRRRSEQTPAEVTPQEVAKLIGAMDSRGAWITDIEFLDIDNYADNPRLKFKGIDTRTYISNMRKLMSYLKTIKK